MSVVGLASFPELLRNRVIYALAAMWGLAEATIFFIVPDVLLSRLALTDRRTALLASVWATAAAIAGGIILWVLGDRSPEPVRMLLFAIPAISSSMVAAVNQQIVDYGAIAVFIGPVTGTPYKIYAVEAASAGVGLLSFALISIPARLIRFVLVSILASAASQALQKRLALRKIYALHAAAWIGFYGIYFSLMSGG